MTSILEEIESTASRVAEDATFVGPATAAEVIADWERRHAAETKKVEESRTAFEGGAIAEADVYAGDPLTMRGLVVLKMVASGNGYSLDYSQIVTVETLKRMPVHFFDDVIAAGLRGAIKNLAIKKMCKGFEIDPDKFHLQLHEERLAAAQKLTLRDWLTLPPAAPS